MGFVYFESILVKLANDPTVRRIGVLYRRCERWWCRYLFHCSN